MFKERITKGLTLFTDSELSKINIDMLEMTSPYWCVVGQVTGDYEQWVDSYVDKVPDIDIFLAEHGILLPLDEYDNVADWRSAYDTLTREWQAALTDRRLSSEEK